MVPLLANIEAAVKAFRPSVGLDDDGIVGTKYPYYVRTELKGLEAEVDYGKALMHLHNGLTSHTIISFFSVGLN